MMKKIIFTVLTIFIFTGVVKASEWQEEKLEGDNVEMEYRYRFYKDVKKGEYIRIGEKSDYSFEDLNDITYSDYSPYNDSCPEGEGYITEYAKEYIYETIGAIQAIKISNLSEENFNIVNFTFRNKDEVVEHTLASCTKCANNKNTIKPGGTLLIKFASPIHLYDLNMDLDFEEKDKELMYEIVYSSQTTFYAKYLAALLRGYTNISTYKYEDLYYLYTSNVESYTGYDIEVNELIKVISVKDVCRTKEVLSYRYNIVKEYYDDYYYKDVSELINLTEEEKSEYKKDLEDYKIYYRDNTKDEVNEEEKEDKEDIPSIKDEIVEEKPTEKEEIKDKEDKEDKEDIPTIKDEFIEEKPTEKEEAEDKDDIEDIPTIKDEIPKEDSTEKEEVEKENIGNNDLTEKIDNIVIKTNNNLKEDKPDTITDNNEELKLVKTGIEKKPTNYKYIIIYTLGLILIGLLLIKKIKIMSEKNND